MNTQISILQLAYEKYAGDLNVTPYTFCKEILKYNTANMAALVLFWDCIFKDTWILLADALPWLVDDTSNKNAVLNFMTKYKYNYIQHVDYEEVEDSHPQVLNYVEKGEQRQTKHYIVTPKCLKRMLFSSKSNNSKSKKPRFIDIEYAAFRYFDYKIHAQSDFIIKLQNEINTRELYIQSQEDYIDVKDLEIESCTNRLKQLSNFKVLELNTINQLTKTIYTCKNMTTNSNHITSCYIIYTGTLGDNHRFVHSVSQPKVSNNNTNHNLRIVCAVASSHSNALYLRFYKWIRKHELTRTSVDELNNETACFISTSDYPIAFIISKFMKFAVNLELSECVNQPQLKPPSITIESETGVEMCNFKQSYKDWIIDKLEYVKQSVCEFCAFVRTRFKTKKNQNPIVVAISPTNA
jgi:hypothetical protein